MPSGTLRIIVCIKQVPKAQELSVAPVPKTLKRVGVPSEINPPDANALEIALQIKDRQPAEIVVVSMGPTAFDESLERAVAMGADRAVLLTDRILGGSDTVPTAYAL
ncbi:MAG: electron transfer flavoprotein subunit beta, partial [Candidatus Thermoplasmatota archaeon]